jgi:hypothetical protein
MRPQSEWLVLAAAALIAWPIWSFRGAGYRAGDTIETAITLITSDREDLSCALHKSFNATAPALTPSGIAERVRGGTSIGKYRCEYSAPRQAWPTPPTRDEQLVPCFTLNRQLLLVPGLFEQPALAARYAQEPPSRVARSKLRRFIARCKLRLVEQATGVQVRWVRGKPWDPIPTGWVAEPVSCSVTDE